MDNSTENQEKPKFTRVMAYSAMVVEIDRLSRGDKEGDRATLIVSAGWWHDTSMGFEIALQPMRLARCDVSGQGLEYIRYCETQSLAGAVQAVLDEWHQWCDGFWGVSFSPEEIIRNWYDQAGSLPPFSFSTVDLTKT